MRHPFELVIFDCDGVLVDSEGLGNRVIVEAVAEHGLILDLAEAVRMFRGGKMSDCVANLSARLGRPLPEDFVPRVRERTAEVFLTELQAIPGIQQALDQIDTGVCVASSAPREKITLALSVTGLLSRFEDRIFSAYEVGSWKPAPDLFLHAAAACGIAPSSCAVVEDSVLGVRAGIAAGMRVFAYAADSDRTELESLGATTFDRMADLPGLLYYGG